DEQIDDEQDEGDQHGEESPPPIFRTAGAPFEAHVLAEAGLDRADESHALGCIVLSGALRRTRLALVCAGIRDRPLNRRRGRESRRLRRRWTRRGRRGLTEQRREVVHLTGLAPLRHAGVPDHGIAADGAAADETRDLVSRDRSLLIACAVEVVAVPW